MKLPRFAILSALLGCSLLASGQSFTPKTIQFNGDSERASAELATAAGLVAGETITVAKVNESTQLLLDTGLFEDIRFSYNDQLLAFQVIPAEGFPIRLENFPVNFGNDLESRLRARFPLYRGKVPASGTMLNTVSQELQEELAAIKISAAVSPSLYSSGNPARITAISYSIANPDVRIGEIQLGVLSGSMVAKVRATAAKITDLPYTTESSQKQVEDTLANLYTQQGYLEAKIHATPKPQPIINAKGVHIPYVVAIDEGPQYKLAGVQLSPDLIVQQAAFDQANGKPMGEIASPDKLRPGCDLIAREYHKKGFLKAQVVPVPTFSRALGTVNYLITVQPGPQYTMGALQVEDVDDTMRPMIAQALHMPQGSPFNEGAIIGMTATHNVNPELERFFATENLFYKLNLNDDAHTVDVDLTPQKKP